VCPSKTCICLPSTISHTCARTHAHVGVQLCPARLAAAEERGRAPAR
jgi:hypothetical protein